MTRRRFGDSRTRWSRRRAKSWRVTRATGARRSRCGRSSRRLARSEPETDGELRLVEHARQVAISDDEQSVTKRDVDGNATEASLDADLAVCSAENAA